MRIIRWADCKVMPWKNGGGTTTEIICVPPDAENFDWRISVADVVEAGPFSRFPGYERHIVVIEGQGMDLISPNGSKTRLNIMTPHVFSGDDDVRGELPFGPARDLNLIVRRGFGRGKLFMGTLTTGSFPAGLPHNHHVVHVVTSTCSVKGAGLAAGDSLYLKPGEMADLTGLAVLASCAVVKD
jgi:uncharacterized protein